ncbi:MAG: hypothetical protein ACR2N3_16900 [Pyrinomonadaceae bacterium]
MATDTETFSGLKAMRDLPDEEGAKRFFNQLAEAHPAEIRKLQKKNSLLSDVLTIAAFSPLLAVTLLQNPSYISWLERQRDSNLTRSKEELLESLARFSLTNSQIEPQVLLSRFRRRELLRIYLRDIRRHGTIAEMTEEISNLADAILEYALQIARQELENRYGIPLEQNEKQREKPARFCIVSLGKLGSRELNYSSDIDLIFVYSGDGETSGKGARGAITNREYFIKLAELVTKIVGGQIGEGAAYRVDLRLRPHGSVGALAISLDAAISYYQNQSQAWERQTLIRARSSAGDAKIFKEFWRRLVPSVYSTNETVENALRSVKLSKDKINLEHAAKTGFDVKLGRGGIREIEFIAQALQLAYGGRDKWLRSPHTLISLARLADRKLLSETELSELSDAYEFLRRLEHRLQMEHGLQTHLVPENTEKKLLVARRMNFKNVENFDSALSFYTANVNRVFERVFGDAADDFSRAENKMEQNFDEKPARNLILSQILTSIEKSDFKQKPKREKLDALAKFSAISPHFAEMISANPRLAANFPLETQDFQKKNYEENLSSAISAETNFAGALAALRTEWTKCFLEIAAFDVFGKIDLPMTKRLQTELAEASIKTAVSITEKEILRRYENELRITNYELRIAVLGLGKLGGRGMDYGSDLDLVLIYDDEKPLPVSLSHAEFYSRAVDIFVTTLSSFTREGNLYRVDLRLRPDGKNGASSIGKNAFLNYLETRAAIWEWLAYVKLRGVAGDLNLAAEVETRARKIIHENALRVDKNELKMETLRVRERLAREKSKGKTTDIKFDAGGLLDIYFAMRFLQLRDNIPDDAENRSTLVMLKKLYENKSLSEENFSAFSSGHQFLNLLDHNLRLTVGRSNSLPLANKTILQIIAARMNFESADDLLEKLALHRIEIHSAFENILKD